MGVDLSAMLSALADPILPIFAVMAFGVLFARRGLFEVGAARALNQFVFYVGQPCLMAFLAANASVSAYDWPVMGVYLVAELILYVGCTLLFAQILGFALRDAILLAMACMFINHFYFVLPIAVRLSGEAAAEPIQAVAFVDAVLLFCGTVFVMELIAARRRSWSTAPLLLARNPTLLGLAAGLAMNLAGDWTPAGLLTFVEFSGAAAAPALLFALGVTLADARFFERDLTLSAVIGAKMLATPLLTAALLGATAADNPWTPPLIFLSAGPSGAMAFVLAMQYGAPPAVVATISKAILATTFLSLFSLAALSPLLG